MDNYNISHIYVAANVLLDRASCKYCKNKNLKELRNIYHYMPDVWQELKHLQNQIEMPFKNGKTIHDLEKRFISEDAQIEMFDYLAHLNSKDN